MSYTPLKICNIAAGFLGVKRITSLSENSKQAILFNEMFEILRDDVQSVHFWNFNTRKVSLASLPITPLFNFSNAYQVPTDSLAITMLEDRQAPFEVEEGVLYCNRSPAKVKMTVRITDPSKFSVGFVLTLAYRIAAETCYALTQSQSKADKLLEQYLGQLRRAKGTDGIEGRLPPIIRYTLLDARIRGGLQTGYARGLSDV